VPPVDVIPNWHTNWHNWRFSGCLLKLRPETTHIKREDYAPRVFTCPTPGGVLFLFRGSLCNGRLPCNIVDVHIGISDHMSGWAAKPSRARGSYFCQCNYVRKFTSSSVCQHVVKHRGVMDSPIPFVEWVEDTEEFNVNEAAVKYLSSLTGPVAVVAVAGKYRTGKSYLLNLLSEQPTAFEVRACDCAHVLALVRVYVPRCRCRALGGLYSPPLLLFGGAGWANCAGMHKGHLVVGKGNEGGGPRHERTVFGHRRT